jgi:methyl-accepting chemotaxis protein
MVDERSSGSAEPATAKKAEAEWKKQATALAGQLSEMIGSAAIMEVELDIARSGVADCDQGFTQDMFIAERLRGRAENLDSEVSALAAAAEETAAATEEMAASIQRISQESGSRYSDLVGISELSAKSQSEMGNTLAVVRQVASSVDALKGFIETINDIAERTSLLAMNASIEAAHAGNAGKGFAVIAGEIRKLAASASENSSSITSRLKGLIDSIKKAEESTLVTSQAYSRVGERMKTATDSFLVIKDGTEELAIGGREIREAVGAFRSSSGTIRESSAALAVDADSLEKQTKVLAASSKDVQDKLSCLGEDAGKLNLDTLASATSAIALMKAGMPASSEGLSREPADSVLALLTLQHQAWVARARAVLDGKLKLDPATVGDHHQCDLGHWLDSDGKEKLSKESWDAIDVQHEALHRTAKEIIIRSREDKAREAEILFNDLMGYSRSTIKHLREAFTQ